MVQFANTQFLFWRKEFECTECKAIFNYFFQHFGVPFDAFLFQTLIKGKYLSICLPVTRNWFFF